MGVTGVLLRDTSGKACQRRDRVRWKTGWKRRGKNGRTPAPDEPHDGNVDSAYRFHLIIRFLCTYMYALNNLYVNL